MQTSVPTFNAPEIVTCENHHARPLARAKIQIIVDELPLAHSMSAPATFPGTRTVHVRVKPLCPGPSDAGLQTVQMSLLCDLRHRLDRRTLNAEQLAALMPEMADDGRPQCMVCLDELEEGQVLTRQECGHTFHHECMATWLVSQLESKQVGACPHCKHTIVVPVIKRIDPPVAVEESMAPLSQHVASRAGCFGLFNFRSVSARQQLR